MFFNFFNHFKRFIIQALCYLRNSYLNFRFDCFHYTALSCLVYFQYIPAMQFEKVVQQFALTRGLINLV